jgi:hypothetical protein
LSHRRSCDIGFSSAYRRFRAIPALTGHETEHFMGLLNWTPGKSGKDIRLTEYAGCAG